MSNQKKQKKTAPKVHPGWIAGGVIVLLIAAVVIIAAYPGGNQGNQGTATGNFGSVPTAPKVEIQDMEEVEQDLGKGLMITDIGSYTGLFVEDGSDTVVSRVLMVVVKNIGASTIQYGEVKLTDGEKTANFKITTLPPGESAVLLELNKMPYSEGKALTQGSVGNVATFATEPGLCQDRLKIQTLNGVLNITNISGEDIEGDIVIYYKNAASDMLYGGITYRVSITGGLKKNEIRQVIASHFYAAGSRVMFVTIG